MNSFLIPNSSQPPFKPQSWQRCLDGGNPRGCSRWGSETQRPDTATTTTCSACTPSCCCCCSWCCCSSCSCPSTRPPSPSQEGAGSVFPTRSSQSYHAEHEQITCLSRKRSKAVLITACNFTARTIQRRGCRVLSSCHSSFQRFDVQFSNLKLY